MKEYNEFIKTLNCDGILRDFEIRYNPVLRHTKFPENMYKYYLESLLKYELAREKPAFPNSVGTGLLAIL